EKLPQHVSRARRLLVVSSDPTECLLSTELPSKLAPERPYHRAVRLHRRIARRNLVADEHDPLHLRQAFGARLGHHSIRAGPIDHRCPGKEVIEGEHRVRLAASEVRLELDNRIAAFAADSPDGTDQKAFQTLREVRPPEELLRVAVFGASLTDMDLPQI